MQRVKAPQFLAWLWLAQRLSGVLLLGLLAGHLILIHYLAEGRVTYQTVARRLASPATVAAEATLLVLGIYHGFFGLWTIIEDYVPWTPMRLTMLLLLLASAAMLLGTGLITLTTAL